MNKVEVFNFETNEVRTVVIDNEVWLVGKDVAKALGYSNTNKAVQMHVDKEDKTQSQNGNEFGQRGVWLINQSGVISLALSSKLPTARKFKRWVTSEVIPTVLKTGGYQQHQMTPEEIVGQALRIEHERAERLQAQLSKLTPKAQMHDVFIETAGAIGVREASKELNVNQNEFVDNLINFGYAYRGAGRHARLQPYKKYVPKLFVLKTSQYELFPQLLITPYGREFFYRKFYASNQIEMIL